MGSPVAVCFRVFREVKGVDFLVGFCFVVVVGEDFLVVVVVLPGVLLLVQEAFKREKPRRSFSRLVSRSVVAGDGRAPRGVRVLQEWSSGKRCFRQYVLLQVWQWTPRF